MEENKDITAVIPDTPADTPDTQESGAEAAQAEPETQKKWYQTLCLMSPVMFFVLAAAAFIFLLGAAGFADFAKANDGKLDFVAVICGVAGAAAIAGIAAVCIKGGRPKVNRYALAGLLAVNFYFVNEFCLYIIPTDLANDGAHLRRFIKPYIPNILVGILMYFIFFFIAVAFVKNRIVTRILLTLFSGFFAFYAILQYYIIQFRGGPIRYADLANITSAGEISDEYHFSFSYIIAFAVIDTLAILAAIWLLDISEMKKPMKARSLGLGSLAALCVGFYFAAEGVYSYDINNRIMLLNFSMGEDIDTYQDAGGLLTFYYDGLKNRIIIPDGYSADEAKARLAKYAPTDMTAQRKPTIIAILNESFADFEHLGDIDVNMDYMPNYRALKENCIKGYVTVSPYGGYSCNSEYEFLTGSSMYFLPSGSATYTQFMDTDQQSMVSHLNALGYNTVALTCCRRGLWKIENAYKRFGFDKAYYKDNVNLKNIEYINGGISDDTVYRRVEEEFEKKPKDESMFVWVTTMQNHAPYNSEEPSDREPITLTKPENMEAQIYLNSIYEADKAMGELLDYFRNVDEDVVIVFFGDHYPHIGGFYDDMLGKNINDLPIEEFCHSHQTPYFIWANYDIESKEDSNISLNYIGNELMDVCGLPKSDYMNFLEEQRENLPIITSFGYVDGNGEWHKKTDSADDDTEEMKKYRYLQYYRMFDEKSNKAS
ncbi:MAG: LTA synthase family protein [Ruminococcus sp.]|nr:LTA synthase family protein [Ruminococcus sp.]